MSVLNQLSSFSNVKPLASVERWMTRKNVKIQSNTRYLRPSKFAKKQFT